jgi:plastocyanin
MKVKAIILHSLVLLLSAAAWAQNTYDVKVGQNGHHYVPKTINCSVGDTIRFIWVSGSNTTRFEDFSISPNFSLSASNPVKLVPMNATGNFTFYSTSHGTASGQGMSGQINVNGLSSNLANKSLSSSLSVFPNPAEDKINVNFVVRKEGNVVIRLLDVLGNDVAVLSNERYNIGDYKLSFNVPSRVTKGLYFVKVSVGSESAIKRISIQ